MMRGFEDALDRYLCEGPSVAPRTVDVRCAACGEELEARRGLDTGTETLDPGRCPGCGHDDALGVAA